MTTKKEKDRILKSSHERLLEIGQILFNAIKRLKVREDSKNNLNQLDSNAQESVHGVDINSKPR